MVLKKGYPVAPHTDLGNLGGFWGPEGSFGVQLPWLGPQMNGI